MVLKRLTGGYWPWLAITATLLATALELRHQGRRWWCACGQPNLWTADVSGPHNSQHLLDPYSLTHVLHGVALCGLLAYGVPRLGFPCRLWLGIGVECLWEIIENTNYVIDRYRAATAALGYQGDTVCNSLGDIGSFVAGFVLARWLGVRGSVALFISVEILLLLWIRDSLTLNVIMLIYPFEAIKAWQLGR